jgi:hypothetical protein
LDVLHTLKQHQTISMLLLEHHLWSFTLSRTPVVAIPPICNTTPWPRSVLQIVLDAASRHAHVVAVMSWCQMSQDANGRGTWYTTGQSRCTTISYLAGCASPAQRPYVPRPALISSGHDLIIGGCQGTPPVQYGIDSRAHQVCTEYIGSQQFHAMDFSLRQLLHHTSCISCS